MDNNRSNLHTSIAYPKKYFLCYTSTYLSEMVYTGGEIIFAVIFKMRGE